MPARTRDMGMYASGPLKKGAPSLKSKARPTLTKKKNPQLEPLEPSPRTGNMAPSIPAMDSNLTGDWTVQAKVAVNPHVLEQPLPSTKPRQVTPLLSTETYAMLYEDPASQPTKVAPEPLASLPSPARKKVLNPFHMQNFPRPETACLVQCEWEEGCFSLESSISSSGMGQWTTEDEAFSLRLEKVPSPMSACSIKSARSSKSPRHAGFPKNQESPVTSPAKDPVVQRPEGWETQVVEVDLKLEADEEASRMELVGLAKVDFAKLIRQFSTETEDLKAVVKYTPAHVASGYLSAQRGSVADSSAMSGTSPTSSNIKPMNRKELMRAIGQIETEDWDIRYLITAEQRKEWRKLMRLEDRERTAALCIAEDIIPMQSILDHPDLEEQTETDTKDEADVPPPKSPPVMKFGEPRLPKTSSIKLGKAAFEAPYKALPPMPKQSPIPKLTTSPRISNGPPGYSSPRAIPVKVDPLPSKSSKPQTRKQSLQKRLQSLMTTLDTPSQLQQILVCEEEEDHQRVTLRMEEQSFRSDLQQQILKVKKEEIERDRQRLAVEKERWARQRLLLAHHCDEYVRIENAEAYEWGRIMSQFALVYENILGECQRAQERRQLLAFQQVVSNFVDHENDERLIMERQERMWRVSIREYTWLLSEQLDEDMARTGFLKAESKERIELEGMIQKYKDEISQELAERILEMELEVQERLQKLVLDLESDLFIITDKIGDAEEKARNELRREEADAKALIQVKENIAEEIRKAELQEARQEEIRIHRLKLEKEAFERKLERTTQAVMKCPEDETTLRREVFFSEASSFHQFQRNFDAGLQMCQQLMKERNQKWEAQWAPHWIQLDKTMTTAFNRLAKEERHEYQCLRELMDERLGDVQLQEEARRAGVKVRLQNRAVEIEEEIKKVKLSGQKRWETQQQDARHALEIRFNVVANAIEQEEAVERRAIQGWTDVIPQESGSRKAILHQESIVWCREMKEALESSELTVRASVLTDESVVFARAMEMFEYETHQKECQQSLKEVLRFRSKVVQVANQERHYLQEEELTARNFIEGSERRACNALMAQMRLAHKILSSQGQ